MTGWRLGFAVGNAELVGGLGQVKSQIDSGAFDAVQIAASRPWKATRPASRTCVALHRAPRRFGGWA